MSFADRVADVRLAVRPHAVVAIAEARSMGERSIAGDRLLRLNFAQKSRLMELGACWAVGVEADWPRARGLERLASLVRTFVFFGALFTMIDTAIDEGGVVDRASCDRLASFLVVSHAPAPESPLEEYLSSLATEIERSLRAMPGYAAIANRIEARLRRHAHLITFQHVAARERAQLLAEVGVGNYEELCHDGSPGPIFAMIRACASKHDADVGAIEELYFPEFGLLHVLADDFADVGQDAGTKDLNLALVDTTTLVPLLEGYLRRLAVHAAGGEVLFPLRLVFEEYHQAAVESGDVPAPVLATFAVALAMVRDAEETLYRKVPARRHPPDSSHEVGAEVGGKLHGSQVGNATFAGQPPNHGPDENGSTRSPRT